MCGIAGFVDFNKKSNKEILKDMTDILQHRGPDDSGYSFYNLNNFNIGLGHRRLSILDLSFHGHQPMKFDNLEIVYNGEVYNFKEIRNELEKYGYSFESNSDAEVILKACHKWGIEETVKKLVGMFAFAMWDREKRTLYLARDRMGEKPLYYGWQGKTFIFASELKALKRHPCFKASISQDALALYLRFSYVPAPYTIYEGIYKLPPGCWLRLKEREREEVRAYWSVKEAVLRGKAEPFKGSPDEAVDELEELLTCSIKGQMIADVPLGAFLSGGIDSSTVVALMQKVNSRPVRTFSIGFYEDGYNEAPYAKRVAEHLGTEHTELYVTPKEAMEVIPKIPEIYNEPFADSSQIPTYVLSKLTKQYLTVSLSGDGGDELFGGYDRYRFALKMLKALKRVPRVLRLLSKEVICSLSPEVWDAVFSPFERIAFFKRLTKGRAGDRLYKLSEFFEKVDLEEVYRYLVSSWKKPDGVVIGGKEPEGLWPGRFDGLSEVEYMMYADQITYLPDDILVKMDRAAMAVSLETRIPLLDHRIVEFAWRLLDSWKIKGGKGKWILRKLLYRYVPKELMERPKHGFGVPIDDWLKGDLRDWAEELLAEDRLKEFFDPRPIRKMWVEHLNGVRSWHYYLWDILMFQTWVEKWEA